jgi:hypothetical protein
MGLADGREEAFKAHVDLSKQEFSEKRIQEAKIVREKFIGLMNEAGLTSESRYDDFKSRAGTDLRFVGMKDADRNEIFNEYVIDLGQTERKIRDMQRMEASMRDREREVESQRRGVEGRIDGVKRDSEKDVALATFNALMNDYYTGFDVTGLDGFAGRCKDDARWSKCDGMASHIQQAAFTAFGKGLWGKLTRVLEEYLIDRIGRCECLSSNWYVI